MAKDSKPGKESAEAKKLIKEQEATEKAQAEREAEVRAEEETKVKATAEAEPAPVIATQEPLPSKERAAAWEKFLKAYEEANPVKYAIKKKAGEYKSIPASFTGQDQLNIKG